MSGIITGPHFRKYFHEPGPLAEGTMVAVLEVGAFGMTSCPYCSFRIKIPQLSHTVTSLAAGQVGDILGRKGTLFIGAIIFTIGGAIQTFTVGFASMIVGRIVSGFGVGLLSSVTLLL
jgi:MFS family permease